MRVLSLLILISTAGSLGAGPSDVEALCSPDKAVRKAADPDGRFLSPMLEQWVGDADDITLGGF